MKLIKVIFFVSSFFVAVGVFAKVQMPKIFGDNMLLQRDIPAKLWGTATPKSRVSVALGKYKAGALVDGKGNWFCYLPMMPANKTPQTLVVNEDGKKALEFKNVLVGDVWLASGQSNMGMLMKELNNIKDIAPNANNPLLRYFIQSSNSISRKPMKDFDKSAQWLECTPDTVGRMSAIGYFFGDKLSKSIDVPVAIIFAAKGATQISCWIPENCASKDEHTKKYVENFNSELATYNEAAYKKKLAERNDEIAAYEAAALKAKQEGKPKPARDWRWREPISKITPYLTFETPYFHYNGKIAPLVGITMKGIIWYQGESNSSKDRIENYDEQLKNMVLSWRDLFRAPLPVLCVQLPSYTGGKALWPELRWYQYQATKKIPHFYIVNTIDCGEEKAIHPQDKEEVASRLEKMALFRVYGDRSAKALFPEPIRFQYKGDTANIKFNLNRRKFAPKGDARGFEVLVGDNWVEGVPEIRRDTISVKAKDGGEVKGVRYLWKNWAQPDVWLFDSAGIPALSFIDEAKN